MDLKPALKTTLDALARAALPPGAASSVAARPAAGGAPLSAMPAAPVAATEIIDWAAVAAAQNAQLSGRTVAALPVSGTPHAVVAQPARHGAFPVDWPAVAASVNAELGLKRPGANVDPALAAHLTGSAS